MYPEMYPESNFMTANIIKIQFKIKHKSETFYYQTIQDMNMKQNNKEIQI